MTTDALIKAYSPVFTDWERAKLIHDCTSFSSISQFGCKHKLAMFEHAIECGVAEVRRKNGYEFSFFQNARTLADLRGWLKAKQDMEDEAEYVEWQAGWDKQADAIADAYEASHPEVETEISLFP